MGNRVKPELNYKRQCTPAYKLGRVCTFGWKKHKGQQPASILAQVFRSFTESETEVSVAGHRS